MPALLECGHLFRIWREVRGRPLRGGEALEEGEGVLGAELARHGLAKAGGEKDLEVRHRLRAVQERRHVAAVEVAAERDGVLAAELEPVLDVGGNVVEGHAPGRSAVAQEGTAVGEAHDAAAVDDCAELVVGEVAGMAADGAGVGVARREGAPREPADVREALAARDKKLQFMPEGRAPGL